MVFMLASSIILGNVQSAEANVVSEAKNPEWTQAHNACLERKISNEYQISPSESTKDNIVAGNYETAKNLLSKGTNALLTLGKMQWFNHTCSGEVKDKGISKWESGPFA